jgi:hypothetical protein
MAAPERSLDLPQDEQALGYETLRRFMKIQDRVAEFPDPEMGEKVKEFLNEQYLLVDFFLAVPELDYNARVNENTPQGPSASTRDNLMHLIKNMRARTDGLKTGELTWVQSDPILETLGKRALMGELMNATEAFVDRAAGTIQQKLIKIPDEKPNTFYFVSAIQYVGGMARHAVYHQGIANAGAGDLLGIPRLASFKRTWGS